MGTEHRVKEVGDMITGAVQQRAALGANRAIGLSQVGVKILPEIRAEFDLWIMMADGRKAYKVSIREAGNVKPGTD